MLGTIADELASIAKLFLNIEARDCNLACRRQDISGQCLECGGLASTIHTKQSEAFTIVESERGLFHSSHWCTTERIILLLEIMYADAVLVPSSAPFVPTAYSKGSLAQAKVLVTFSFRACHRITISIAHHGDTLFFRTYIVVFRQLNIHSAISLGLTTAQARHPVEEKVDLELNHYQKDAADEADQNECQSVKLEVVPRPDIRVPPPRDDNMLGRITTH